MLPVVRPSWLALVKLATLQHHGHMPADDASLKQHLHEGSCLSAGSNEG